MFVFATSSPPLFGRRHLMSSPPLFGRKAIADLSQNGNIALLRFHKDTHSLTKLNYKKQSSSFESVHQRLLSSDIVKMVSVMVSLAQSTSHAQKVSVGHLRN
ncbi:cys-loop ligand-gated ion channel isoform X3 [Biomphalaria glabrata]|nr:cys-loop ligand-gated ion channel isoform X3 [Biomphalaria glabrata]